MGGKSSLASREGEEIDFHTENPNQYIFIEAKVSSLKARDASELPEVRKVFKKKIPQLIVCHQEGIHILNQQVPLARLKEFLMKD